VLRVAWRGAAILAVTLILLPFQVFAVACKLRGQRRISVLYHRILCGLLGVRITVRGMRAEQRPLLLVANHVSWLDVSVIAAIAPAVFVAKAEVAGWPLIGFLARLQRSVFVNRRRRHETGKVNDRIASRLIEGDAVVLFAEGTSSDGNRVLPFHTALLGAAGAVLAAAEHVGRVAIQPLSIAYVGLGGLPMGRRQRPVVAWYGNMEFLPHFVGVLKRGALDVVVTCGDPVAYDLNGNRKTITRVVERQVRQMTVAASRRIPAADNPPPRASRPGHSFLGQRRLRGSRDSGQPR
jgi:1-acyl-sn-glycerol-3-phosphate acyltransferase